MVQAQSTIETFHPLSLHSNSPYSFPPDFVSEDTLNKVTTKYNKILFVSDTKADIQKCIDYIPKTHDRKPQVRKKK